jgi:hypothetical protein
MKGLPSLEIKRQDSVEWPDIEEIFREEVGVGSVRKPRYNLFSVGVVISLQMSITMEQEGKKENAPCCSHPGSKVL